MTEYITQADFEEKVLRATDVVLVDFFAPWCGPCQALSPVIDEIAGGMQGAKVYKIDVDSEPELATEYSVMSIPTLKIFKGGQVVEEMMGVQSKEDLEEALRKHM